MKILIPMFIVLVSIQLNAQVFNKKYFAMNDIPNGSLGKECISKVKSIAASMSSKNKNFTASYWGRNMDAALEVYQISAEVNETKGLCVQISKDSTGCEVASVYENSCDSLKSFYLN